MFRRAVASFLPKNQPWITRQSYRYELVNALSFPVGIALVEGSVVGVLATKAFDAPPYLFATLMAAPMFANVTSFVWSSLARGRRKVRFINGLQILLLLSIASVALLPREWPGPLLLTGLVVFCRCLLAGIVTLRSTVWRMNYPRHVRAQITGKLALLQSLIVGLAPLAGYSLLDLDPEWFRYLYPASVLIAAIGVINFSKIRLRNERELLAYEATPVARPQPRGDIAPVYEYDPKDVSKGRENFWTVLKRDRTFRSYMTWQFVAGGANMMGEVVIVAAVSAMTAELAAGEWFTAICLTTAVPMLLAVATLPRWSAYLDRVHVVEFRATQGWWWVGNQALNWVALMVLVETGAYWAAMGLLLVSRIVQGVTRGGGMLAWNLGHNDFADRRLVTIYMGIHVTLTGIRGAVMPFVAMAFYTGWGSIGWLGLPEYEGIGYHVFLVTTAMALVAEWGFHSLHKSIQRAGQHGAPTD